MDNSKFKIYLIVSYFFLICIDGLVKGFFSFVGFYQLAYFKDLILLILVFVSMVDILRSGRINYSLLVVSGIVLLATISAQINDIRLIQSLFAFRIFLPFLVSLPVYKDVNIESFEKPVFYLILVSLVGLILDAMLNFSWIGGTENIGGIDVGLGSAGTIGSGIRRLSGFGSSNGMTAFSIISLWFIYEAIQFYNSQTNKWRVFTWLLSLLAIMLTTNKTALFSFIIVSLLLNIIYFKRKGYGIIVNIIKWSTISFITIYSTVPVIYSYWFYNKYGTPAYSYIKVKLNFVYEVIFGSFLSRVIYTWPAGFEFLEKNGNLYSGRGLGGIGVAQKIFETEKYNPGDGLFLTLVGIFGLPIASFCYIMIIVQILKTSNDYKQIYFVLILIIGATHNVVDISILVMSLGLLYYPVVKGRI